MPQRNASRLAVRETQKPTPSRWSAWRRGPGRSAPPKSRLQQNVESLLLAILVALLVRASVVEAFWVPSGSMLPTIQIGDHLFVNKLAYGLQLPFVDHELTEWRPLHRGDIIVFTSPVDHSTDLIKRVIAVAGDTVEIRDKRLFINGREVPDPHAHFTDPQIRPGMPRDNFGPVQVPPGKFFVMGDNRDLSYDSRYWGFADDRDVKGEATFIYLSWNSNADWFHKIRWDRFGRFLQ